MKKRQVVVKRDYATSSPAVGNIRYGECQKNHAANTGGYAVDGCREFMASACEGTNAALTCAACGCHRNFHKREVLHGVNWTNKFSTCHMNWVSSHNYPSFQFCSFIYDSYEPPTMRNKKNRNTIYIYIYILQSLCIKLDDWIEGLSFFPSCFFSLVLAIKCWLPIQ